MKEKIKELQDMFVANLESGNFEIISGTVSMLHTGAIRFELISDGIRQSMCYIPDHEGMFSYATNGFPILPAGGNFKIPKALKTALNNAIVESRVEQIESLEKKLNELKKGL